MKLYNDTPPNTAFPVRSPRPDRRAIFLSICSQRIGRMYAYIDFGQRRESSYSGCERAPGDRFWLVQLAIQLASAKIAET